MNKKELEALEAQSMADVVRRRGLGGFDVNAADILRLCEREYRIIQHLVEQLSRKEQLTKKKRNRPNQ